MDWADLWKLLSGVGIVGAGTAWVQGWLGGLLPPAPMVARAIRHRVLRWRGLPVAEVAAGTYHLVLCGLDGDDAREGTLRLLQHALDPTEYPMLHVTLAGRRIRRDPKDRERLAAAAAAERVLRAYRADLVLWGEVVKQGDSLRLFLRGAGKQETQVLVFDKGLAKERPDGVLGAVVCAVAVSQVAPVTEEGGRYLVAQLRPVIARLRALLRDRRMVPEGDRGRLHHALGLGLAVIGDQAGEEAALHEAVFAYEAALLDFTRDRAPLDWAGTQNNLGITLAALGARGDVETLRRAVAAYEAALEEFTRESTPLQWATTLNNYGNTLIILGERGDNSALQRAVEAYKAALEVLTRDRAPTDWAMTQDSLGTTLATLGARGDMVALDRAIIAFHLALEERTRDRAPLDWATTQNNLGNALQTLGESGNVNAPQQAIAAHEMALEEFTRDRTPFDWAMTQNNLGNALQTLGERGDESAPHRAVAAFEAALQEWTHSRTPLRWATTQNNLGNTLWTLGERGDDAALRQAIAAYEAALEVFRRFDVPPYIAAAERNLARARALLISR